MKGFFATAWVAPILIGLLSSFSMPLAFGADETSAPTPSIERVVLHTNFGDMVLAFFPDIAPQHVAQIEHLVEIGVYNGANIFRVERGFVAQVENFNARPGQLSDELAREVKKIPGEFSKIKHRRGLLSMARYDNDVNSAESSFSIMLGDAPHLDGQYTIFGEVLNADAVLAALDSVSVNADHQPGFPLTIYRAELIKNGDLSHAHIAPAQLPGPPDQTFFKVFAAIAFFCTVSLPFVKTLAAPKEPKGRK